ncbi:hypothetical protein [Kribbella albertanoniae]|uniref:AAA+ ATPase domain-containing protein n=1 Tax=Kribbella albertanoniae TaxID=1266829 RepID=A0A4R4QJZ1_9ACTN|nr:hypothetical protein [Kribbella albertanoniae]TDC35542.1 hypothetical protein E1261_01380 [Kribbella albertanoniae]
MTPEDLWANLRQGARNVAGVTWQINVCAYLLVASRSEHLSFVDLIPEGYEDADCSTADGKRAFVQMKELDGGRGEMGPARLADALAHAEASARGSEIIVVTDGSLGSDLSFTGWDSCLGGQSGEGIRRVLGGLTKRGYAADVAEDVLARARVIRLPYRVRQASEVMLADALSLHPSVSGIVVSKLTDVLAHVAADQRRSSSQTAARVRTSDIDAIVAEVHETVDITALDQAVASGVCAPVSFLMPDEIAAQSFYLGVDGHPGHVAADLDVLRPDELLACNAGFEEEGSVLLVGPSGAGKSVLLWRAARDLVPAARVLRVSRVQDEDDARILARYIRLLRPSEASPVMLVADDLGRPRSSGWPLAAALLREIPFVLLLSAARAEDFSPALLVGATRVVEPRLDLPLARALSARLRGQGIPLRMNTEEAFQRSDSLLMEYLALLTTGQRLRQVLAAQVAALQGPGREIQREAARLVTTAHTLGLTLSADVLGRVLVGELGPISAVAQVGDALGVLRDEHIAVSDGAAWRGLHELRSAAITELLHENPPPRLGSTLARVAALIEPANAGWMLRRVAERHPECVDEVVLALRNSFSTRGVSPADLASFLEGAERADNALYAKATLPVLEQARPRGLPLETLATFVYPRLNQGLGFEGTGSELFDNMVGQVKKIADNLPLRSDYETTLRSACSGSATERPQSILGETEPLEILRFVEAGLPHLKMPIDFLRSLFMRIPTPHNVWTATIWSRLCAACEGQLTPAERIEILGSLQDRVALLCTADPSILDAVIDETTYSVKLTRLLPLDAGVPPLPLLPWDIPRATDVEALNRSTVACLERLKDACSELNRFEIVTVTASGSRYQMRGFEPGHKDMLRKTFPGRVSVRQSVGYQAAVRRAISSQTWTEVINVQIAVAADLAAAASDLPLRLKPHDNAARRVSWRARIDDVRSRLGALHPPPIPTGSGPTSAQALSDNIDRTQDETTRLLHTVLDALDHACPQDPAKATRHLAIAITLREAADQVDRLRRGGRTLVQGQGSVLPDNLSQAMRRSADLAVALHRRPALASRISGADPLKSAIEIWAEVVSAVRGETASMLRDLLAPIIAASCHIAEDPAPAPWALSPQSWVVMVPANALDETLTVLETLSDAVRDQVGAHLVVLCVAERSGLAAGNTASAPPSHLAELISLGVGYQLSSTDRQSALPLPPEMARAWSHAVGLSVLDNIASPLADVEQLVSRSHEAARRRMRKFADPGNVGGSEQTDTPTVERPPHRLSEVNVAVSLLQDHVAAEEHGTASAYLSEVILSPVTGEPLAQDAAKLLDALTALHLHRLRDAASEQVEARQAAEGGA